MKAECQYCWRETKDCKRIKLKDKDMIVLLCKRCRENLPKRTWKVVE